MKSCIRNCGACFNATELPKWQALATNQKGAPWALDAGGSALHEVSLHEKAAAREAEEDATAAREAEEEAAASANKAKEDTTVVQNAKEAKANVEVVPFDEDRMGNHVLCCAMLCCA